jgi:hypothetical protein
MKTNTFFLSVRTGQFDLKRRSLESLLLATFSHLQQLKNALVNEEKAMPFQKELKHTDYYSWETFKQV